MSAHISVTWLRNIAFKDSRNKLVCFEPCYLFRKSTASCTNIQRTSEKKKACSALTGASSEMTNIATNITRLMNCSYDRPTME